MKSQPTQGLDPRWFGYEPWSGNTQRYASVIIPANISDLLLTVNPNPKNMHHMHKPNQRKTVTNSCPWILLKEELEDHATWHKLNTKFTLAFSSSPPNSNTSSYFPPPRSLPLPPNVSTTHRPSYPSSPSRLSTPVLSPLVYIAPNTLGTRPFLCVFLCAVVIR